MKKTKIISTILIILLFCNYAIADIINVPGDQPTIQAGINAANNDDTVLVADGTYTGADNINLDFGGKAITLISQNGAENTIIDCEDDGRGFYFHSGEDSTSVVDGFTVTNGFVDPDAWLYGAGIYCDSSSPALVNLAITNCVAGNGGAIMCNNNSSPIMANITVTNNWAYFGGGIMCKEYSSPNIKDVMISNNVSNLGAGANFLTNSCPTLKNVTICNNFSYLSGGGISCSFNSNITLKNVTISENSSDGSGGGMHCASSSPILDSVTVFDNTAVIQGGGIVFIDNSNPTLTNVAISENSILGTAVASGGGIACVDNSSPSMMNVTITNNSIHGDNIITIHGAGLMCYQSSNPSLINVTISGNTASGTASFLHGGGIYVDSIANPTLLNSILWNNSPEEIYITSGSVTATYSDIQDGWSGIGNINTDPLFADPQNGDFHLTWENFPIPDYTKSPCINAGDPSSPPDPDGTIADMGAFYFDQIQTGIEEDEIVLHLFQIYPNPTTGIFTIEGKNLQFVEIINISGQIIKQIAIKDEQLIIDLNEQPKGAYFVKIQSDNYISVKKIVIQ